MLPFLYKSHHLVNLKLCLEWTKNKPIIIVQLLFTIVNNGAKGLSVHMAPRWWPKYRIWVK